MRISLERSILIVAEQFLLELIKKYGKNPVLMMMMMVVHGIHKHVDF